MFITWKAGRLRLWGELGRFRLVVGYGTVAVLDEAARNRRNALARNHDVGEINGVGGGYGDEGFVRGMARGTEGFDSFG